MYFHWLQRKKYPNKPPKWALRVNLFFCIISTPKKTHAYYELTDTTTVCHVSCGWVNELLFAFFSNRIVDDFSSFPSFSSFEGWWYWPLALVQSNSCQVLWFHIDWAILRVVYRVPVDHALLLDSVRDKKEKNIKDVKLARTEVFINHMKKTYSHVGYS